MVADVTGAFDFGSSLSRTICAKTTVELQPELILISPQVVELPKKSIENYEKYKIGETSPENSAWVELEGKYFAVGYLAKNKFHANHSLQDLKVESAVLQVLAMIGSFAQRVKLPPSFSLAASIVLPWNELQDKEKFKIKVTKALSGFTFRGQSFLITLQSFTALPEGAGILARGRVSPPGELRLRDLKNLNIVIVMLGYRNSSILVIKKGELSNGITSDLGFSRMIEKIQSATSGQTPEMLLPVVAQVRGKLGKSVLATLARCTRKDLREIEIEEINKAINDAREEYVVLLQKWLLQQLPHGLKIDELLISGGTSLYLKTELIKLFKPFSVDINWCHSLEDRLNQTFGDVIKHNALEYRLADVYGLFYKTLDRPLPFLKKSVSNLNNVRTLRTLSS